MSIETHNEQSDERIYTIAELCREFGVTARALRFYEQRDMLKPAREGQKRLYSVQDRSRVKLIVEAKRYGFMLREIRELLDLHARKGGTSEKMLAMLQERLHLLTGERDEMTAAIVELERNCQKIAAALGGQACRGAEPRRRPAVGHSLAQLTTRS